MEHNEHDQLRRKVRDAEMKNVAWNREDVWSRINGTAPSKKSSWPYAAAASFALLATVGIYSWLSLQRRETNLRLHSLELEIEKARTSSSVALSEKTPAEDCETTVAFAETTERNPLVTRKMKSDEHAQPSTIAETESPTEVFTEETSVAVVLPLETPNQTVATSTESQQEFTPTVITILPPDPAPKVQVARERKFRFNLFRKQHEPLDRNDNSDEILFAIIH